MPLFGPDRASAHRQDEPDDCPPVVAICRRWRGVFLFAPTGKARVQILKRANGAQA